MFTEIKAVLSRSSTTMIEDALGVASLFTMLVACLCLPGLV
jgi:hypothetical protein